MNSGGWDRERALQPTDVPTSGEAPLAPPWEEWHRDAELQLYRYAFAPMLYLYVRGGWHLAGVRARWQTEQWIAYRCHWKFSQAGRLRVATQTYLWGSDAVRVAMPPGRYLGPLIPPRGQYR